MKKKFKFKPVVMLASAGVIAENFETNKAAFLTECPHWGDGYIAAFKDAINAGYNKLGIKSHNQLKQATNIVVKLQTSALDDLGMVKTQIERGFKDDKTKMKSLLDQLGYSALWKKVKTQTVMIELLFAFRNNLTIAIREELTGKGVNAVRIDAVIRHAEELNRANITQETLKGDSKILTEAFTGELNSVYNQTMDICKIGRQLFKKDSLRKEMFNFSKITRAQIAAGVGGGENEEEAVKV